MNPDLRERIEALKAQHDLRVEFPYLKSPRRVAGGTYMLTHCPFPTHVHQNWTASLLVFADHYTCLGCQARGDLLTLVQWERNCTFFEALEFLDGTPTWKPAPKVLNLTVPPPSDTPVPAPEYADDYMERYFLPLTESNAETLRAMGLTMETLDWAGVKFHRQDVYAVPMWSAGKLVDIQIYSPVWKIPAKWHPFRAGVHKVLYQLEDALAAQPPFLLLFEGPKNVWFAHQLGAAASATGGAKIYPVEMALQLTAFPRIYVWGDNDEAGQNFNLKWRQRLRRARPVDFRMLGRYPPGYDFADLVGREGLTYSDLVTMLKASDDYEYVRYSV